MSLTQYKELPWITFTEESLLNNNTYICCRECMTSIMLEITAQEKTEFDAFVINMNTEYPIIQSLQQQLSEIKANKNSWNIMGYCGIMHLDFCKTLLDAMPLPDCDLEELNIEKSNTVKTESSIITNYSRPNGKESLSKTKRNLYHYIYCKSKINIPMWYNEVLSSKISQI